VLFVPKCFIGSVVTEETTSSSQFALMTSCIYHCYKSNWNKSFATFVASVFQTDFKQF
jgi:hypothetical protein